ncbi:MAG: hypothetical protein HYV07_24970 [Deltaproteobacteria bacterium]|nr:hypothetical protein [Deltaproteobacteria bacterium]
MNESTLLLLGGLLPAVLFGLDAVCSKLAVRAGVGAASLMTLTGVAMATVGFILTRVLKESLPSAAAAVPALAKGLCSGLGIGLVGFAIMKGAPLSKITPIYNANGLVAVAISLVFFAEAASLDVSRLLLGTVLVVTGAALVASA